MIVAVWMIPVWMMRSDSVMRFRDCSDGRLVSISLHKMGCGLLGVPVSGTAGSMDRAGLIEGGHDLAGLKIGSEFGCPVVMCPTALVRRRLPALSRPYQGRDALFLCCDVGLHEAAVTLR